MDEPRCSVPDSAHSAAGKLIRGMCGLHYQRWKNNGDPLVAKRRWRQAEVCERDDCAGSGFMRGLCLRHYREVQKSEHDPCSVENCDEPWVGRGLCTVHYHRFLRTGSTDDPLPVGRPCSIEGCDDHVRAKELCERHYKNVRKHGTPEAPPKPKRVLLACTVEGCEDLGTRRSGMCNRHYREDLKAGKPRCGMPGCATIADREGFCERHGGWRRQLFRKYGISSDQYDELLAAQGGRCAICRRPPEADKRIRRLVVDHDHACCPGDKSCGKCVRGLLCNWCNRLLGMALDEPGRLRAAIRYLEATATRGQLTLFAA